MSDAVVTPLIGISTYREQARWGVWDELADVLPATYARSVERAGGVPVLLPPGPAAAASAAVARLDGLLLSLIHISEAPRPSLASGMAACA
ncbi:gamma-glutamyl-gamma-aminobutyrate hydrolase family protein [Aeromicrobium fastidiosum]|uniref:gamma-glutamyl-gamma-aminobutyrate hydrolase family protein n=1 Tax=Aeromicrobium fastidiosum TaxID=52699 RepID=UPI002023519A|nr:gamma-glutamyl-gamma-aminobutyrate hydrolase family protein [Aeromicrobium fastidiosum]MCL8253219.1 gamma-glutamyl-gamma-aminobutyrate hydrolase family protein [Aeromicrobium fastidiosum]